MLTRTIVLGVIAMLAQAGSPPGTQTAAQECQPGRAPLVQMRLDAVAAAPTQFLPKLELARCYDLAWRLSEVEPAILNALATLNVEARTAPATGAPAPGPLLAGTDVPVPAKIQDAPAVYPDKAYVDGVTGLVIVEAVIDRAGKVREAKAVQSIPALDAAAVTAVKKWRFAPVVSNGQTVEALTYWPLRFGGTRDLWANDWLQLARFYYSRGLFRHAASALNIARDRAVRDSERYGDIVGLPGATGPVRTVSPPPARIQNVNPKYPPAAQSAKVSGQVLLQALIDRFGEVGRVTVLKPVPMLDLAAQEAVSQWKYAPPRLNDQPVSTVVTVFVSFTLK